MGILNWKIEAALMFVPFAKLHIADSGVDIDA